MGARLDEHGVELLFFEHAAVVLILAPFLTVGVQFGGFAATRQPTVRHGHDARRGEVLVLDEPLGAAAHADESHLDAVVGATHRPRR